MTRICFYGRTGFGKTLTAVYQALNYYYKGYKIYSNIHLKGEFKEYTYITNTNFTKIINNKEKNVVLIDEIGKTTNTGRSHNAINFSNIVAQSRKSFGEDSHLLLTTQIEQFLRMLEGLIDYEFFPQIVLRDEYTGKPLVLKLEIKRVIDINTGTGKRYKFIPYANTFLYYGVYECCDFYDTYEEVESFGDGEYIEMQKIYKNYVGKKGKLEELANKIQFEKGKNISESKRLARAVIGNFQDKHIKK
jgi:hypothetical protein